MVPLIQGPLDLNPKENQPKSKTNTNNNSDTNLKATETLETSKNQPTPGPSKNNKNPDQPAPKKKTNEANFDEMKDQANKTKKRNLTQTLSFESIFITFFTSGQNKLPCGISLVKLRKN